MASSAIDSIVEFVKNNAVTIILTILVGVVSFLIGEVLLAYWKKPKLVIEVSNLKRRQGKLGFSVYVRKKEVKDATVRCNNIKYEWEKEDGTKCEKVDLRIGDPDVTFYPFDVSSHFIEDLTSLRRIWATDSLQDIEYSGGVQISVTEPSTKKIVYQVAYAVPRNSSGLVAYAHWNTKDAFSVRIRVVGEGIEEENDYILRVGLNNLMIHPIIDGKPLMEYVDWGFEVKKTSKFPYRKKEVCPDCRPKHTIAELYNKLAEKFLSKLTESIKYALGKTEGGEKC